MQDHVSDHAGQANPTEPTKRSIRSIPVSVIAGLSTLVLIAGSATAWWTLNSAPNKAPITASPEAVPSVTVQPDNVQVSPDASRPSPQASPTTQAPTEQPTQIYWLKDNGARLELVPSPLNVSTNNPEDSLKAAFEALVKGPSDPTVASTIPQGTGLLSLNVQPDGIHVDLSKEFVSGGGSASMSGRLAQVLYTATSLEPTAKVWISVDGSPLEVLGGEGLVIDQPMTRADFERDFEL